MFSQTAEYSLRAMVWLASHPDSPLTTQEIAAATQVPPDYLSKVLRSLARAGLVQAQRGKHGGFALTRSASEITALEIVNAVDPVRRIQHCPLNLDAHRGGLCAMHRRLDDAIRGLESALRQSLLSELIADAAPGVAPDKAACAAGGEQFCRIAEVAHA